MYKDVSLYQNYKCTLMFGHVERIVILKKKKGLLHFHMKPFSKKCALIYDSSKVGRFAPPYLDNLDNLHKRHLDVRRTRWFFQYAELGIGICLVVLCVSGCNST